MDKKQPIELCFREESVFMTRGDISGLVDEEWFLSVIVGDDYWKEDINRLEMNEDKNTVMSIIETMRYSTLIVLKDVSIDYMIALAEKWCIPEMFIELMKTEKETPEKENNPLDDVIFICDICKTSFKMSENKSDSCKVTKHLYQMDDIFVVAERKMKHRVALAIMFCVSGINKNIMVTMNNNETNFVNVKFFFILN